MSETVITGNGVHTPNTRPVVRSLFLAIMFAVAVATMATGLAFIALGDIPGGLAIALFGVALLLLGFASSHDSTSLTGAAFALIGLAFIVVGIAALTRGDLITGVVVIAPGVALAVFGTRTTEDRDPGIAMVAVGLLAIVAGIWCVAAGLGDITADPFSGIAYALIGISFAMLGTAAIARSHALARAAFIGLSLPVAAYAVVAISNGDVAPALSAVVFCIAAVALSQKHNAAMIADRHH